MYVVSGHYDSSCTNVRRTRPATRPGADDDASGVIAVLEMARVMATHQFDATIVFMAVAGRSRASTARPTTPRQAKAAGDGHRGDVHQRHRRQHRAARRPASRDPHVVRLFAEGVPTTETPAAGRRSRQSVGGENDSPSRQLARFVEEVAENHDTGMDVQVIYRRDRYLRGGDHIPFLEQRLSGGALHRADEDLRAPAPGRARRERRAVRRPAGVRRLRLHRPRRARERGRARGARARAGRAEERRASSRPT